MIRFESDLEHLDEHHEVCDKLLKSVEPLPFPAELETSEAMVHWVT